MKTNTSLKVILVACVGALASCATQPTTTRVQVSSTNRPHSTSLSGKVYEGVNDYRLGQGKLELERHAGLDRLAQEHCEYLRAHRGEFGLYGKNVSHIGFEGRSLVARERYQMMNISENVVAANQPGKNPVPNLIELWKKSKGHEFNMKGAWTHTGVGAVVDSDGMVFSTQLFATVSNSQMTLRNRFNSF